MNIRDRIKAIDDEYSESEIYLEYGLPSLMLYEPTPYKNLRQHRFLIHFHAFFKG